MVLRYEKIDEFRKKLISKYGFKISLKDLEKEIAMEFGISDYIRKNILNAMLILDLIKKDELNSNIIILSKQK